MQTVYERIALAAQKKQARQATTLVPSTVASSVSSILPVTVATVSNAKATKKAAKAEAKATKKAAKSAAKLEKVQGRLAIKQAKLDAKVLRQETRATAKKSLEATNSTPATILSLMGLSNVMDSYDTAANDSELDPTGSGGAGQPDTDLSDVLSSIPFLSNAGNTTFELPSINVGSGQSGGQDNTMLFVIGGIVAVVALVSLFKRA